MWSKLIIVESPSKCKKIEGYAGRDYKCLATCGHIYSLVSLKDIDIANNYKPTYRLINGKRKHLTAIQECISKINPDDIYVATDPDREGEAIAWHLCQHFNLSVAHTKRILFNEITKDAVRQAIHHPIRINMQMVESQQARQSIDVLVGFKTCPILWKYLGIGDQKSPLSAGRCQTPCLKLVQELHDKEHKKQLKHTYKLSISFNIDDLQHISFSSPFTSSLESTTKTTTTSMNNTLAKAVLLYFGNNCDYNLRRTEAKKSILKAPPPLTTSLLQQKANQYLGMSPAVTMKTAQKLYEKGLITYMRTDSQRYSKEFITKTVDSIKTVSNTLIKPHYKDYLLSNPYSLEHNKAKGASQDGHESIRPTAIILPADELASLTPQEQKLYYFILYHVLQTFMKDCVMTYYDLTLKPIQPAQASNPQCDTYTRDIERTKLDMDALLLKTTLRTENYLGWKAIETKYKTIINGDEAEGGNGDAVTKKDVYSAYLAKLPDKNAEMVLKNDALKIIQLHPSISGEAKYYSEANLVRELEHKQIGRPSTFASLVEKIQSRHYVFKTHIQQQEVNSPIYSFYNIGNKDTVDISNCQLLTNKQPNRLVIQELGKNVNAFCYSFFDRLFNYEFTASLENDLDLVVSGQMSYTDVCRKCDCIIDECIAGISNKNNDDDETTPHMEFTAEGATSTAAIKNKYKTTILHSLGMYEDKELLIKCGIYGYYAQHGTDKYSLRNMHMIDVEDFKREDVINFIEKQKLQKDTNLLREIDDKISIWKGKKGKCDYIMIKANHNKNSKYTKKPKFISLKSFPDDYLVCVVERIKEFIQQKINP